MQNKFLRTLLGSTCLALTAAPAYSAIMVTETTDSAALAAALGGYGLTINSATLTHGAADQIGTYTNFSQGPVTFDDGIVLSTGKASDTKGPPSSETGAATWPSTDMGVSGTAEFDDYGSANISNFGSVGDNPGSNDVARLELSFTLSSDSAVSFDFIFGSVEFPEFTGEWTDAFLVFLDGTTNQIVYDGNGDPVQVGVSFASLVTTADENTAFAGVHGLIISLTTTTTVLAAGTHTLLFEVGDVNDHFLDSAVFISNFQTSNGIQGTDITAQSVPEIDAASGTSAMTLLVGALAFLGERRRRPRPGATA